MLVLKIALRNLFRHTRRTLLLATIIIVGVGLLFAANAVFERSARGLKTSFLGSLTGNLVIAANQENIISIFGNEMPLVTEYEIIPPVPSYYELSKKLSSNADVAVWTPVVTATVRLEVGSFRSTVPIFGVNPETYFEVCSDIEIIEGDSSKLEAGGRGIFLNSVIAEKIEKKNGKKLVPGEALQMSIYVNGAFRIRKAYFAGIHQYVNEVQPFDKIVLCDPLIVREMLDYSLAVPDNSAEKVGAADELFSIDDLFLQSDSDIQADASQQILLEDVEALLAVEREVALTDSSAWSFILVKTAAAEKVSRQIESDIRQNNLAVKVLDWKTAAGLSAQMAFALQAAFAVGIVFIVTGAVLVIMNGLVISVLERKSEIGTMRAVGAKKSFISRLFIAETLLLVLFSTFLGLAAGITLCLTVMKNGIPLQNSLLITLFGGKILLPVISYKSIILHLAGAVCIGTLAWIYPVFIALRIQPVNIMAGD